MSIVNSLNRDKILLPFIKVTGAFSVLYNIVCFVISYKIGIYIMSLNFCFFIVNYLLFKKEKVSYISSCNLYLLNCSLTVALLSILNTGGIYSPILVSYIMLALVAVLFFGKSLYSWFWLAVFVIILLSIAIANQLGYVLPSVYDKAYNVFFYSTCLIGIPICAFLIAMKYEKENEATLKVLQENEALAISNEEKDLLIKEIHHRIKNNLQIISSLINLQTNELTDQKTIDALNVTKNRIYSLSLIHQKLFTAANMGTVNFKEHIIDLINYQKRTFYEVESSVEGTSINIGLDIATPLSLIVSELLINSFKHAFKHTVKPKIMVTIALINTDNCELNIRDNGCGLPENFNFEHATSLGTEIVQLLVEQIEAKITYSTSSNGTEFSIVFNPNFKSSSAQRK